MLHFSHMIAPERPKDFPEASVLSPRFSGAFSAKDALLVEPRKGAYARTADNTERKPWEALTTTVQGSLNLREHPEILRSDLPGRLDITGDLILDIEQLNVVTGQDINVEGSLILYVPEGSPNQKEIQSEAWAIDGMSIGRDVVVRERKIPSADRKYAKEEVSDREKEYTRLAAMSREQFTDYLVAHRKDYAVLSKRQMYNDPDVSKNELYELVIIKPSRRGRPMTELSTPIFSEQIRAKGRYENDLRSLLDIWNGTHNASESSVNKASASWGRWIINGGFPTKKTTPKGYITLSRGTVDLTAKRISELVQTVQRTGVRCQMKIPTSGTRMTKEFDNIVLHSTTPEDVQRALTAIKAYCDTHAIAIEATEVGEDGEGTSHSNRLAGRIQEAWEEQRRKEKT